MAPTPGTKPVAEATPATPSAEPRHLSNFCIVHTHRDSLFSCAALHSPPYSLTPSATFLLPCLLLQSFLLPADPEQPESGTESICVWTACTQFSSLRCLGRPAVSMAFLHRAPPPPPPIPPCLLRQVNSHMQHTCIVTSHTGMHAHTVPEPPITFLPLAPTNTPTARSGALL